MRWVYAVALMEVHLTLEETMNIPSYSTNGLLMIHGGIKQSLTIDDNIPDGKDKPYDVRIFPDWKKMSDAVESELRERKVKFAAIPW